MGDVPHESKSGDEKGKKTPRGGLGEKPQGSVRGAQKGLEKLREVIPSQDSVTALNGLLKDFDAADAAVSAHGKPRTAFKPVLDKLNAAVAAVKGRKDYAESKRCSPGSPAANLQRAAEDLQAYIEGTLDLSEAGKNNPDFFDVKESIKDALVKTYPTTHAEKTLLLKRIDENIKILDGLIPTASSDAGGAEWQRERTQLQTRRSVVDAMKIPK